MRRLLRVCGASIFVAVGVIIPISLATPAVATARPVGAIAGLLELCIPPVPATTFPVSTTVPDPSGTTASTTPPLPDFRFILTPAPSFALLLKRRVVVQRAALKVALTPDGPVVSPYYDGKSLMTGRFDLRAAPGHYLVEALQVRRRIAIIAGRTTHLRVMIQGC